VSEESKPDPRPRDVTADSGDAYLELLHVIADEDVVGLKRAQLSYGNSWKQRGGVGAYMMLVRKSDRLENRVQRQGPTVSRERLGLPDITAAPYDLFGHVLVDPRAEGVIDDIRDLRRYLLLVEAELRARGFDATHRDNKES
jgi:hypothetical protein